MYDSKIKGMLKGLNFTEDEFESLAKNLSGGEKSRLLLASILLENPDLLLLDEPTNHLDIEATMFLENFLRSYNKAFMVISHDRYFLDRVCKKIFHLENKKLTIYNTNYTDFIKLRDKEYEIKKKAFENQAKEIERQKEIIRRFKSYATEKFYKKARSREKLLAKVDVFEDPKRQATDFHLNFESDIKSGQDILSVENAGKSFGEKKVFSNISFDIYKNDRVGIIGKNGIGKTSLIKSILGEYHLDEGEVNFGSNIVIGYYDQEQKSLNKENTVIEEIYDNYDYMDLSEIRNYLGAFGYSGENVFKEISSLSGGEKGRLSLLKIMLKKPNFLIMDEPTNHLDIESKEILENALKDYKETFLIISHDRYFLNKVVNKLIVVDRDGCEVFLGNYDYYLEKLEERRIEKEELSDDFSGFTKTELKKIKKNDNLKKKNIKKIRADIRFVSNKIEELEEEIEYLNNKLTEKEVYEDYKKAFEINNIIKNNKEEIDLLFDKWQALEEELDSDN